MYRTVAVQAGGQSTRMGQNKALMPFLGQPLIERVCQRLAPLADEMLVVAHQSNEFTFLGLPVILDAIERVGPLGGLYTAVLAARHSAVVVVACDMPFVNPNLFAAELDLLEHEAVDVVIPASLDGLEPLHAVFRREICLPVIWAALQAGERRLISWFPSVKVRVMPVDEVRRYDPDLRAFLNLNTVEEFRRAEDLAQQEG